MFARRYEIETASEHGTTWYIVVRDGKPIAHADTYDLADDMISQQTFNDPDEDENQSDTFTA